MYDVPSLVPTAILEQVTTNNNVDSVKCLAVVPTLLSVVGSFNTARLVRSSHFRPSPKQILLGISILEVISTLCFSVQSLVIPRHFSHFHLVFISKSWHSCWMQFSIASYIVCNCVSLVYLCKSSKKSTEEYTFVYSVEPWLGTLGILYPILTALVGISMKIYSSLDFTTPNEHETGYVPVLVLLGATTLNSLILYVHHRNTGKPQAVATSAVLMTYLWTGVLRILESNDLRSQSNFYPLMLLQAVLLPLMGLLNAVFWFLPRYQRVTMLYPKAPSKQWRLRRAIWHIPVFDELPSYDYGVRRRCRF